MRVPAWFGLGLLGVGACSGASAPAEPPIGARSAPESAPAAPEIADPTPPEPGASLAVHTPAAEVEVPPQLASALQQCGVTLDDYVRADFYTWTTVDQAQLLRSHKRLLFKDKSSAGELSFFDRRLEVVRASEFYAAEVREVAQLLQRPALRYRRFGWSNPWGTARGWGPVDSYGSALVHLRLKPQALIGRFDERGWEFRSLTGELVPTAEVLGGPAAQRIGAIYHVWDSADRVDGAPKLESRPPFREFIFPNESMIESWELDTPELRQRLERDRDLMAALVKLGQQPAQSWLESLPDAWGERAPDFVAQHAACLAFASPKYAYSPQEAGAILGALSEVSHGAALQVRVTARYGQAPPAALLKPPPKPNPRVVW